MEGFKLKSCNYDEFARLCRGISNITVGKGKNSKYYLGVEKICPVGGFRLVILKRECRVMSAFVLSEMRGRGYMARMLDLILNRIDKVTTRCYQQNINYWKQYADDVKKISKNVYELQLNHDKIKKYIKERSEGI